MTYYEEITRSMTYLSKKKDTIFLGQAVTYPGTAMFGTLKNVNKKKKIELPVAEEMQMGMSLGMSMEGLTPITIYPRWNFLLLATNQIVNHVDKINKISNDEFNPKLIIRTAVGSKKPLDPQSQHLGDFSDFFKKICKNIKVIKLNDKKNIFNSYRNAYEYQGISLLVEVADKYNE
tara:strand:+ start:4663 stop:5190 length:528 start_codon:yes stop_codon:yes gene_type:complete